MAFVPRLPSDFSEDSLALFVSGSQNFQKGKNLIACGDVTKLQFLRETPNQWDYEGFVHAEKTANKNYLVRTSLTPSGILSTSCTCQGGRNTHKKCKHVAALLLSLFLLTNHLNSPPKWITNRKKKLARFSCPPDWPLYHKLRFDLDWDGIKKGFFEEVPRHNDITSPVEENGKKKTEVKGKKDEEKDEKEKEKEEQEQEEGKRKQKEREKKKAEDKEKKKEKEKKDEEGKEDKERKRKRQEQSLETSFGPPKRKRSLIG